MTWGIGVEKQSGKGTAKEKRRENKEMQFNSNLSSNQEPPLLLPQSHFPDANSIQAQRLHSDTDKRVVTLNMFIYSHVVGWNMKTAALNWFSVREQTVKEKCCGLFPVAPECILISKKLNAHKDYAGISVQPGKN